MHDRENFMNKNRFIRWMAAAMLACALLGTLPAGAQTAEQADPFLGTWKLNTVKSKYPTGTCPKQMTIAMTRVAEGVHYLSESTLADGRTTRSEYTAEYGVRNAVVRGVAGVMLPVSLKRLDAHTVDARYTRGFQVVATSHRVVSDDGRTMTITTMAQNASGESVTTVSVYDKASD
jgi:hypothetical protein